jgi:hypothetical protein
LVEAAGGIGTAAGVVGMLAIRVLIWFLWIKRRKNVTIGAEMSPASVLVAGQKAELDISPANAAVYGDPTKWKQS